MSVTCRSFGLPMHADKASGADDARDDPHSAGDRYPLPTMARLPIPHCGGNANVRWRYEYQ